MSNVHLFVRGHHTSPEEDPESEDKTTDDREDNCYKEIDKEGHEGPAGEGGHHEEEDEHVGGDPGNEESSVMEEDAKEQEEREEKMEDPGREKAGQQKLMVMVNPGETPPDHQSHLSVPLILLKPSVSLL